jgi:RimJ/RimL family protein N-acetyltransferase
LSYPKEWERNLTLRNGVEVFLRPKLSGDTEMVWEMFSSLSRESVNYLVPPFTRERIASWTSNINYEEKLTFFAFIQNGDGASIIGSATLSFYPQEIYHHKANLAMTVHDNYQNLGLGTAMLQHLLEIAKKKELKKVHLRVTSNNPRAIHVYEKCGFKIEARLEKERFQEGKYVDEYQMSTFL